MRRASQALTALCLLLAACKPAPQEQKPAPNQPQAAPAKSYDASAPPTRKQVLRALLSLQNVPLSNSSTCSGVGTEQSDSSVGDYVSGFLAMQDDGKGGNWIQVSVKEAQDPAHGRAWQNDVMIRHLNGDDRWGWGVSFLMRPGDHTVIEDSVRCIGAG